MWRTAAKVRVVPDHKRPSKCEKPEIEILVELYGNGAGKGARARMTSTRIQKAVYLDKRKSSVRLEPVMWDALDDIARLEGISRPELIRRVDRGLGRNESLTAALRIYVVNYYRALSRRS